MSTSVRKPVKKSVKNTKKRLSGVGDHTPDAGKVKDAAGRLAKPRHLAMTALGGLTKLLGMRTTALLAAGGAVGYLAGRITRGGRSKKR